MYDGNKKGWGIKYLTKKLSLALLQLLVRHHSVEPRVRRSALSDAAAVLSSGAVAASLAAHAAAGAALARSYLGLYGGELREGGGVS